MTDGATALPRFPHRRVLVTESELGDLRRAHLPLAYSRCRQGSAGLTRLNSRPQFAMRLCDAQSVFMLLWTRLRLKWSSSTRIRTAGNPRPPQTQTAAEIVLTARANDVIFHGRFRSVFEVIPHPFTTGSLAPC